MTYNVQLMLIAISPPHFFPGEAQLINKLFAFGMPLLHMRKPNAGEKEIRLLIEGIDERYWPQLVLHQQHHIGETYGIYRWHFPERLRTKHMEKQKEIIYSTSIHQLIDYGQLDSSFYSYTFLGPVFDSISKKGYLAMSPENHPVNLGKKEIPLIALGGINSSNASVALALGFDGIAILGWLWQHPDPLQALQHILTV